MTERADMDDALEPTMDPAWVLHADGYDALHEASIESRFAISNGFLGNRAVRGITRGARSGVPARTYVAGLFGTSGAGPSAPGLVSAADWLQIRILLPGGPLVHYPADVSSHRMTLDLKRGALLSEFRRLKATGGQDSDVAIHARTLRLVSLSDRAIGLQLIRFEIEDEEVDLTLEASFEGVELGLIVERLDQDLGLWRTHRTGKRIAMATASLLRIDGHNLQPTSRADLKSSWTWRGRPGQVVCFERFVAVVRTDIEDQDPCTTARASLTSAQRLGWRRVVAAHEATWADRWRCSDVEVEGDPQAQQALRFAVYHLNSAADPDDDRVSIGARALTGDDYRGHVFWDTEIYLLPFYILTWPEAARALLLYRFRTLDGARAKAAGMGWCGALYAWESADDGSETSPEQVIGPDRKIVDILCGRQEQHISADVAYAVWQYWMATGDDEFLLDAGAEVLLETGRFWASRAQPEADGFHHIRGVIGPDEYHEGVDDNAFTNVMARWNIRRALDVAEWLQDRWPDDWARLTARLGVDDVEMKQWMNVSESMAIGLDHETGVFEQFAGYFALEQIDLTTYAGRSVPMDVVLGRERTGGSQVIKQADVVALLGLLPEEFLGEAATKNFAYYEPRCGHGSSLSRAMHGLVAARLGYTELALRYFKETATIDLGDSHATVDGGIHIAALGGVWITAVLGFAGLSLRSAGIAIDPRLPTTWRSLGFRVQWRNRRVKIRIDQARQTVDVTLETGDRTTILVSGQSHELGFEQRLTVPFGHSRESDRLSDPIFGSSAAANGRK
jgi:trehalose/maltose hydrolase-like predicted phosphorylase